MLNFLRGVDARTPNLLRAGLPEFLAVFLCLAGSVACVRGLSTASNQLGLNVLSVVSLGTIQRGSDAGTTLTIANPGPVAVEVARIEASCSCLSVEPERFRVEAGSRLTIALRFHPDEPDFTGRLGIELVGHRVDEVVAFRTRVDLIVEP